jgi:transcription elongation GreA/GreB family factor
MAEIQYFSKEGLQKLRDELKELTTVQRPAISAQTLLAKVAGELAGGLS